MRKDDSDEIEQSILCWEKSDCVKWMLKWLKRNWRLFDEALTEREIDWAADNTHRTVKVIANAMRAASKKPVSGTTTLPIKRFVAAEKFRYDKSCDLEESIGIGKVGDMFREAFDKSTELDVPTEKLLLDRLRLPVRAKTVVRVRGGPRKVRLKLAQVYEFLKVAKHYETYHFFVEDTGGALWRISAEWTVEDMCGESGLGIGDEWEIEAYPIKDKKRLEGYVVYPMRL